MKPKTRPPTLPGAILQAEFLTPLKVTQTDFADRIGVAAETINRLVNGKSSVSIAMALRLSKALRTTPEFWLNLQRNSDLWHKAREMRLDLRDIKAMSRVDLCLRCDGDWFR